MSAAAKRAIVLGLCALSSALAIPPLLQQWQAWGQLAPRLDGRTAEERLRLFDTPGYPVAQAIATNTPETACVAVAAYAGPAAVDYYAARFPYFLYPRTVAVEANSGIHRDGCEYLAVFRDTRQNLAGAPFAGTWNQAALDERTSNMEPVYNGELVTIYRDR